MVKRIHILGAHKAGTTKLYECISNHPDVFGSIPKQTLYFVSKDDTANDIRDYFCAIGLVDTTISFTVDATPEHLFDRNSISKICRLPGEYLCLASIRNPIDRAFSHWAMTQQSGGKHEFLKLALSHDPRVEHIIERSKYAKQIENVNNFCAPGSTKYIIFEQWTKNPEIFFELIQQETGLEVGEYWKISSRNHRYNSRLFYSLAKLYHLTPIKKFVSPQLRVRVRDYFSALKPIEELNKSERRSLAKLFKDDVKETEEILCQKINEWEDFHS